MGASLKVLEGFPTASVPNLTIVKRSYDEVARSLGFFPGELIRIQLLEFFKEEKIKLYNRSQVESWLIEERKQAKANSWCWRPLREKDILTSFQLTSYADDEDGYYDSKKWECRPYGNLVPRHALEKAVKIEAKFGDHVKFFVSDYSSVKPDIFIMVRSALLGERHGNFIFDAWNEPSFGFEP